MYCSLVGVLTYHVSVQTAKVFVVVQRALIFCNRVSSRRV